MDKWIAIGLVVIAVVGIVVGIFQAKSGFDRNNRDDATCYPYTRQSSFENQYGEFVVCSSADGGFEVKPVKK